MRGGGGGKRGGNVGLSRETRKYTWLAPFCTLSPLGPRLLTYRPQIQMPSEAITLSNINTSHPSQTQHPYPSPHSTRATPCSSCRSPPSNTCRARSDSATRSAPVSRAARISRFTIPLILTSVVPDPCRKPLSAGSAERSQPRPPRRDERVETAPLVDKHIRPCGRLLHCALTRREPRSRSKDGRLDILEAVRRRTLDRTVDEVAAGSSSHASTRR